jgi:glutaredoxin
VKPTITLYGRSNCGLCDEAERMLRAMSDEFGFTLETVNIESDAALLDRYVFAIPVVAIGEVEVGRAPIRRAALEDALREALGT